MDQWTSGEDPYKGPQWSSPHRTTPHGHQKGEDEATVGGAWLASHVTALTPDHENEYAKVYPAGIEGKRLMYCHS